MNAQFRDAEDLWNRAQNFGSGPLWLPFMYYTRAVSGYRLAHSASFKADVSAGYRDARNNVEKATNALPETRRRYAQSNNREGLQACSELEGYINSLDKCVRSETAGAGGQSNQQPAPRQWRAPYGGGR